MRGTGRVIYVFMVLGIILNAVSTYFYQQNLESIMTEDTNAAWYLSLGLYGDLLMSVAAVLSVATYSKNFPQYIRFSYWALLILVTIASLGDLDKMIRFPSIIYSAKGIGTYLNIGIMFFTADSFYLKKILTWFYSLCFIFLLLAFVNISAVGVASNREQLLYAIREFTIYIIWVFPFFFYQNFAKRYLNTVNYIAFFLLLLLVISTGSRGYLIIYFLLFIIKIYRQNKFSKSSGIMMFIGIIALIVGVYIFVVTSDFYQTIDSAVNIFTDRVSDDSRSGQLIEFFNQYDVGSILTGVGPTKTWNWSGARGPYGYLDNQYILITWWAGLPTCLIYLYLLACSLFKKSYTKVHVGGKIIITMWVLACAGLAIYVTVSSELYYYFISLIMGMLALSHIKPKKVISQ
ncbi:hypothetical protein AAFN85_11070 [Mucilaginibacter sp. CAU 1740]|uniref:hypothetical protein n=1 Tax=Mucilaginibacter sp. CAU 1740 TaxID=3140365 RepID=UPI00325C26D3